MPSRILRDGILNSKRVNRLSIPAELFYYHLLSVADDYGRYYSNPAILRTATFPRRLNEVSEQHVAGWLKECVDQALLTIYDEGNTLEIHKFGQRCRYTSKFPDPLPDERQTLDGPKSGQSPVYAKAKADSKTKTNPRVTHTGARRKSATHTHVPSLDDVLKFAEAKAIPAATAEKFFDHYEGLRGAWHRINWQNKLEGWHKQDLARAAEKQQRARRKPTIADFQ